MDLTRRSSRANRASQPQSGSHHSSASSNSSGRAERATRSHNKTESPRKSTPSGSLSSEPPDDLAATVEDAVQTRRKRGRGEEKDKSTKAQASQAEDANGAEEVGEDDEAVRCICGFDEYPGPPQLEEDNKNGIREGIEDPMITVADVTEDLAGFFLQCDVCKVWQHGGCVGIMNEDTSPEEYFCEQCRKDLHKIFTAPNGQRYSHYLPLYQSLSRTTSRAASFSKDGTRSPKGSKSGRPSSSLQSSKRRSTMNSRDAAYDEEEQLRRAIEASKGEKSSESTDGGTRRGKRGRSDSEEKPDGPKRQRTVSASPSPSREPHHFASQAESDDEKTGRSSNGKKIRGAAARNHKEKEQREEKERLRQEAANKRNGRAERRRLDDSDPSEEFPLATRVSVTRTTDVAVPPLDPPISSQVATPDTPPPIQAPASHKKGGRPPNARKGKLGKNQYTKDRDPLELDEHSPQRSQSRDVLRDEVGHSSGNKGSTAESKYGKGKIGNSKISMADMKKRVAAILDFISRTQLELAGESVGPGADDSAQKLIRGIADSLPMIRVNGDNLNLLKDFGGNERSPTKEFKDLSCLEMMDVLTRQLVKWQREFA